MTDDILILKPPDIPRAFPVQIKYPKRDPTLIATAEGIQIRLQGFYPEWHAPTPIARTALERDFPVRLDLI